MVILYNYYFEFAHAPGDQHQISGGPDVYETRVLKRPVETDCCGAMDDDVHVGDHKLFVGLRKTHIRFGTIATDEQHFFDELRLLVPQSSEQLQKSVVIAIYRDRRTFHVVHQTRARTNNSPWN